MKVYELYFEDPEQWWTVCVFSSLQAAEGWLAVWADLWIKHDQIPIDTEDDEDRETLSDRAQEHLMDVMDEVGEDTGADEAIMACWFELEAEPKYRSMHLRERTLK